MSEKFILFHGTNRNFNNHLENKHRTKINEKFQGDWICYSPSEEVAWKYVDAARNQNIDPDFFFSDLSQLLSHSNSADNKYIYLLLRNIYKHGHTEGYDRTIRTYGSEKKILSDPDIHFFRNVHNTVSKELNFDINDITDIISYLEGAKQESDDDSLELISNTLNGQIKELPHFVIETLEELGFSQSIPKSRVIKSEVIADNILRTDDPEEAKKAREKGFDLVIYNGENTVDNEPEYLIANSSQIKPIEETIRTIKEIEEVNVGETITHYEFNKRGINNASRNISRLKR